MAVALECINFMVPARKRSSVFGAWRLKISNQTSEEGWSLSGFAGLVDALFYGRGAFPAPCGVEPGRGPTVFLTASWKV